MDQAKRLFNRNGLVWTDGHYKNFDLVPVQVPGRPDMHQVVIFDTGHIYPVNGTSPFNAWENARNFQKEFAVPPDDFVNGLNSLNSGGPASKFLRQQRLNDIHGKFKGLINRNDLPPGMSGDFDFGGAPHIGAERPLYRDIASMDADAADQRFFEHTGRRPPPPPARDGTDVAREADVIRISMRPPADNPAVNPPAVRTSRVLDGEETLDVDIAGTSVGRNLGGEDTLDVGDAGTSVGRNLGGEDTLDVDIAGTSVGRNLGGEDTLDVGDAGTNVGRNFDDEGTLDVDVAGTGVGRNSASDTTRFDNADLDALGNDTLRLGEPDLPGPWAPTSDDLRSWQTADGVMVADDAMLGQGKYADVHRLNAADGTPSGAVLKRFDINTGNGDSHLLSQQQGRVRASLEGSNQLQRADILQAELRHVDAQNGAIIQREVNTGLPPGAIRETIVDDLVGEGGGRILNDAEGQGVARMFNQLNENKIAMEDPNSGNVFLREVDDVDAPYQAGVLDQDRIINEREFGILDHVDTDSPKSVNGVISKKDVEELGLDLDSRLWDEIDHMGEPAYESKINLADFKRVRDAREFNYFRTLQREGFSTAEIAEITKNGLLPTPTAFNYYTLIEKGWLKYEPGVGLTSGMMDIKTAARELPDLPEVLHLTPGAEWQNAVPTSRVDPIDGAATPAEFEDALPLAA